MRQAIDALVGEEVIERVVGLGTFVRKPKLDLQVKLTSYSEEMQRRGMVPAAKVLSFEQIGASAFAPGNSSWRRGRRWCGSAASCWRTTNRSAWTRTSSRPTGRPCLLDGEPPTSLYNVLSERFGLADGAGRGHDRAATAASPLNGPPAER